MKKIFSLAIAITGFFCSCSTESPIIEDRTDTPKEGLQKVEISVKANTEFTSSSQTRSTPASLKSAKINHLYYILYKDNKAKKIKYFEGNDIPTIITDSLPVGDYKVVFYASTYPESFTNAGKPINIKMGQSLESSKATAGYRGIIQNGIIVNSFIQNTEELFYSLVDLSVTKTNSVQTSYSLNRISSLVKVIPQDAADTPQNIESLYIGFRNTFATHFNLSEGTASWQIMPDSESIWEDYAIYLNRGQLITVNEKNPIIFPVFATAPTFTPRLYGHYYIGNAAKVAFDQDFPVVANHIYELRGYLYKNLDIHDGELGVDTTWGQTIVDTLD